MLESLVSCFDRVFKVAFQEVRRLSSRLCHKIRVIVALTELNRIVFKLKVYVYISVLSDFI